jgi:signal transduction histidine kinase
LTIARGHIEAMAYSNGGTPPEAVVALDELDRLGRLVERLLMLAQADRAAPATTSVDLDDLLEETVLRWAEVALRVWQVGELASATLDADPDALRIALDALIENAVEHTGPDDVIEVRSHLAGDVVVVEVANSGNGIPEELLDKLFERFVRNGGERTANHLGLGLAIVDAIVRSHGGSCTATSSPEGTVFALRLPGALATSRPEPVTVHGAA